MSEVIQPVLLGADLNCYSMARAFFSAYGISSYAYGQTVLGATHASRYIHFREVPSLGEREVLLSCLARHAERMDMGVRGMLIPCTDEYARLLMEERAYLSKAYILPLPGAEALPLFDKKVFYDACEANGILYPETIAIHAMPSLAEIREVGAHLRYPFIIKPSSSVDYWRYPFAGMEKVYLAHNKNEAECVLASIFGSGYPGTVLLQRYIAGGDSAGYVLTLYLDRNGRTCMRACGHVLLEEHTPCGKGNYAALVTAPIPPVAEPLAQLLRSVHYHGFANFDLRQDRDDRFYVLELNLRPGRSNYLLTAGGKNPAVLLMEDCVHQKTIKMEDMTEQVLFRTVPFSTVWQYTERDADARLARELHCAGRDACPLYDRTDLLRSPFRAFYVWEHMRRERQKFRHYCMRIR